MSTVHELRVALGKPASEMAQEEIRKQVAFLAKGLSNIRFSETGDEVLLSTDSEPTAELSEQVLTVATNVQRSLRQLTRKMIFSSSRMANPTFKPCEAIPGLRPMANGIVALEGLALSLFEYFDRVFTEFGEEWKPAHLRTPTLIPADVLAKCDYFRSFPHNVTFAAHLTEEKENIEDFRARYRDVDELDEHAMSHMDTPQACLSPAVCYHTYALNKGLTLPEEGLAYSVVGKCFRFEGTNLADLRRLWDFTMREVVFLGYRENVLDIRTRSMDKMAEFIEAHELAGEIRTASDPFFIAPDAGAKTYFQLSSETKFEVALLLPDGAKLAVGSHNHHSDFFGRAFDINIEGHGAMHSMCVAFGLERWVYAFVQQHGINVAEWPEPIRNAPEFRAMAGA
jgi:seryl-tRNA synthetase